MPPNATVMDAIDLDWRMRMAKAAGLPLSLRLKGHIFLDTLPMRDGAFLPWIEGFTVSLWSDGTAILDARSRGRLFLVSTGGTLLLEGLELRGGFEDGNGGGCGRVQAGTALLRNVRVSECRTTGFSGGGLFVMASGSLTLINTTVGDCVAESPAVSQPPARGGGVAVQEASLLVINSTFVRNQARAMMGASAFGGGLGSFSGSNVTVDGSSFIGCTAHSEIGMAWGGGVGQSGTWPLLMTVRHSTWEDTRVSSLFGDAFGGAIGMNAGDLNVAHSSMINTTAYAEDSNAFGGGLGMRGGVATLSHVHIEGAAAETGRNRAWGGGCGVLQDSVATLTSTLLIRCAARRRALQPTDAWGGDGAVGNPFVGEIELDNVTIEDAVASDAHFGIAIYTRASTPTLTLSAAILTLKQSDCATQPPESKLVGINPRHGMLELANFRNLTVSAPGCTVLPTYATIATCTSPFVVVCGPKAVCRMSDAGDQLATPLCECPPAEAGSFLAPLVASPAVANALVAPYTAGCERATPGLLPNWWRPSSETTDVRPCFPFWDPGMPTPCVGGPNVSSYCGPLLSGPRCTVCTDRGTYFDASTASCLDCPLSSSASAFAVLALVIAVACGAIALLGSTCCARERRVVGGPQSHLKTILTRGSVIAPRLGLVGKAKLVFGYYRAHLGARAAPRLSLAYCAAPPLRLLRRYSSYRLRVATLVLLFLPPSNARRDRARDARGLRDRATTCLL